MAIPHIDERVQHISVGKLRRMHKEALRQLRGLAVVTSFDLEEPPLVVLVPYDTYLRMQELMSADSSLETSQRLQG